MPRATSYLIAHGTRLRVGILSVIEMATTSGKVGAFVALWRQVAPPVFTHNWEPIAEWSVQLAGPPAPPAFSDAGCQALWREVIEKICLNIIESRRESFGAFSNHNDQPRKTCWQSDFQHSKQFDFFDLVHQ